MAPNFAHRSFPPTTKSATLVCGSNRRAQPPASTREAMCTQVDTYTNHFASAFGPAAHTHTMAWEPSQTSLSGLKNYRGSTEHVPVRHIKVEEAQVYASYSNPCPRVDSTDHVARIQPGTEWQQLDSRSRFQNIEHVHQNRHPRSMSADHHGVSLPMPPMYPGGPARAPTSSAYGYDLAYQQIYAHDHTVARHYSADAGVHRLQGMQRTVTAQFWDDASMQGEIMKREPDHHAFGYPRHGQQVSRGPCLETPLPPYAYEQEIQRKWSNEHVAMHVHTEKWVDQSRPVDNARLSPPSKHEAPNTRHRQSQYECNPYASGHCQGAPVAHEVSAGRPNESTARYAEATAPRRMQAEKAGCSTFVSSPSSKNSSSVQPSRTAFQSPGVDSARSHRDSSQAPRSTLTATPPSSTQSAAGTDPVQTNLDRLRKVAQAEGTTQLVMVQEPCRVQLRSKPSKSYMVRPPPRVAVVGGFDIHTDYIEAVLLQGDDCNMHVVKFDNVSSVLDGNVVHLNQQRTFHDGIAAFTELRIMVKPSSFEHNGTLRLQFRLCRRGCGGVGDTRSAEILSAVPIHLYSNYTQMTKDERADFMASNPKRRQQSIAEVRTSDSNNNTASTIAEELLSNTTSPRSSNLGRSPTASDRKISRSESRKKTSSHNPHVKKSPAEPDMGFRKGQNGYPGSAADYEYIRQHMLGLEVGRKRSASFMEGDMAVDLVEVNKRVCTSRMMNINPCTGTDMSFNRSCN